MNEAFEMLSTNAKDLINGRKYISQVKIALERGNADKDQKKVVLLN